MPVLLAALPTAAQVDDGVDLQVTGNRFGAGSVQLDWSGGDPQFAVHRAETPAGVYESASLVHTTLGRQWTDFSPAGSIVYYKVRGRSTCWEASADAFVTEDFPDDNLGGEDYLEAQDDYPERRIYLQFPVAGSLPRAAVILSASLILEQVGGRAGSEMQVRQVVESWSENGVSYNTRPLATNGYGTLYHTTAVGQRTWNLTGLMQEWANGNVPAFGVQIAAVPNSEANHAIYAAREDVPPLLCVEWKSALEDSANLLRADSLIPTRIEAERGVATYVDAEVNALGFDQVEAALWFLERYRGLFGLSDPRSETFLDRIVSDDEERTTLFFGTRHENIGNRAEQIAIVVSSTSGGFPRAIKVYGASARLLPPAEKDRLAARIALTPEQARLTAEESVVAVGLERLGEPSLEWFDPNFDVAQGLEVRPTWRVAFAAQESAGSGWSTYVVNVDAEDGSILRHLRDEQTAGDRPGENFVVRTANDTNPKGCWNFTFADDKWFTEGGATGLYPGLPADDFSDGVNAFDGTHQIYHHYYDELSRRSWDGKSGKVKAFVDVTDPDDASQAWTNASYSPYCNAMQFGDGWATADILAHEFTHAVVRFTAGLEYENQSGALNESFADVFASLSDEDWIHGELRYGTSGPNRNLADPPEFGHPDHRNPAISGNLVGQRADVATPTAGGSPGGNDYGWVHSNSGIPNKVAYLVTEGDVHNGVIVGGIGVVKATRLYNNVLRYRLHKKATFQDARNAFVEEARDSWQGGYYGFSVNDVCDVINAWASVGYGTPDFDCDGYEDSASGDGDNDGVPNDRDNCIAERNADQADMDGDGSGDACDGDLDGDGRRNGRDNCIRVANAGQGDANQDGVGDVCDDFDSDGLLAPSDNCPGVANHAQTDTDSDTLGDACDTDDDDDGHPDDQDNCPLFYNASQSDSDGDGSGSGCDNCTNDYNPGQENADNDAQGDACDDDDDNDGLEDGMDNCPQYANPRQIDNDGNGAGMWCDAGERALLNGFAESVELAISFQDANPLEPVRFEIFPCLPGSTCPDVLPEQFEVQVNITMSPAYQVRVVDDRGWQLAEAEHDVSGSYSMSFDADHEYHYDAGAAGAFQGRRYFVELLALPGSAPAMVTGTIDVDTTEGAP